MSDGSFGGLRLGSVPGLLQVDGFSNHTVDVGGVDFPMCRAIVGHRNLALLVVNPECVDALHREGDSTQDRVGRPGWVAHRYLK